MTYTIPKIDPGKPTKQFEIIARGVIKAYVQLNQFEELHRYTNRIHTHLFPDYQEYVQVILDVLDEEYPSEADRLRKLILVS